MSQTAGKYNEIMQDTPKHQQHLADKNLSDKLLVTDHLLIDHVLN